jgi:hypothetical protein
MFLLLCVRKQSGMFQLSPHCHRELHELVVVVQCVIFMVHALFSYPSRLCQSLWKSPTVPDVSPSRDIAPEKASLA